MWSPKRGSPGFKVAHVPTRDGPRRAVWLLAALLGAAALPARLPAQQPTQPAPQLASTSKRAIEDLARELVRAGRIAEVTELVQRAERLGYDAGDLGRLRERIQKEKRGSPDARRDAAAGKRAQKAADTLARDLPRQTDDAARAAVAHAVLWLDGDSEAAHQALGRSRTDDGWVTTAGAAAAERRRAFATAVIAARALPFDIEQGPSEHLVVTRRVRDRGGVARWRGVELNTFESPTRTAALLRQALRARALLQWLRTGEFEFRPRQRTNALITGWEETFEAARQDDTPEAEAGQGASKNLLGFVREEMVSCEVLQQLTGDPTCALDWGALDLCAQLVLEWPIKLQPQNVDPGTWWVLDYYTGHGADEDTYYAFAGTLGARRYLRHLGPDAWPDVARMLRTPTNKLAGRPRLQANVTAAFLLETGRLQPLLQALSRTPQVKQPAEFAAEHAGVPIATIDAELMEWMGDARSGLAQQLAPPDDELAAVRRAVEQARHDALETASMRLHSTLRWDPALDRGCARLLAERDGGPATAAGAEAACFGVTAKGTTPAEAVRALLASIDGRRAVCHIGALDAGAAFRNGEVCLDTGSVRHAVMTDCTWFWPPLRATGIPRRYGPGLPVPEPGLDSAELGYPLTIEFGLRETRSPPEVGLRLLDPDGQLVECYRFDPDRPLPGLEHLGRTFGLIPQQPLLPKAKYAFEVHVDRRERARIEFTTGD
ncbi:MAG: hypothetical protein AB7O97_18915 [Planctomycetota bacterium]